MPIIQSKSKLEQSGLRKEIDQCNETEQELGILGVRWRFVLLVAGPRLPEEEFSEPKTL